MFDELGNTILSRFTPSELCIFFHTFFFFPSFFVFLFPSLFFLLCIVIYSRSYKTYVKSVIDFSAAPTKNHQSNFLRNSEPARLAGLSNNWKFLREYNECSIDWSRWFWLLWVNLTRSTIFWTLGQFDPVWLLIRLSSVCKKTQYPHLGQFDPEWFFHPTAFSVLWKWFSDETRPENWSGSLWPNVSTSATEFDAIE